jgi:hypothetical protein
MLKTLTNLRNVLSRYRLIIINGALMITTGCQSTGNLTLTEAQSALEVYKQTSLSDPISTKDLDSLPAPVKRFLLNSGVVGKSHLQFFRGKFSGSMKVGGEKAAWSKVKVVQYSFLDDTSLTRIFYIRTKMFGIVPVFGRDKYANGKGQMLIRVADLFTVVNKTGPSMDKSELVTFLNDMTMFPAAFLNKRVAWEAIDDTSAKATLTDHGLTVSGIFFFDHNDNIVNFVTDDRTYDNGRGDVRKARWWTPFYAYQEIDGLRVPSKGEAQWDFGDHRFTYAKLDILDAGCNKPDLYLNSQ